MVGGLGTQWQSELLELDEGFRVSISSLFHWNEKQGCLLGYIWSTSYYVSFVIYNVFLYRCLISKSTIVKYVVNAINASFELIVNVTIIMSSKEFKLN